MDWAERIAGLRRWTRNGERAPHKPLLLLYALGWFQRHGSQSIPFSAAEADLNRLLKEFGPPRETSPGYPFHHLARDGVWLVETMNGPGSPGSEVRRLRESQASGRLHPDLVKALSDDSRLIARLARVLLDANFEPTLHADICLSTGLELESLELGHPSQEAFPGENQLRRDPAFREHVVMAYEYCCAFCEYDGWLDGTVVGPDAAHVRWWAFEGPDELANGLCLCALHHKLFDKGVFGLTPERTIGMSAKFVGRTASARSTVLSLGGARFVSLKPGSTAWSWRTLNGMADRSSAHPHERRSWEPSEAL